MINQRSIRIVAVSVIFISILTLISFPSGFDILSVNSGGGQEIVINPNSYINSFFVTPPPVTPITPPTPTPTPSPSGGGGVTPSAAISVSPKVINTTLATNTNVPQTISVTNLGTSNVTLAISQNNLTGLIILSNSSITLAAGETKNITATFVAPNETGVYLGSIDIGSVTIPVQLTVKKVLLLFDSKISVLNPNSVVLKGNPLETQVNIIPMGESVRVDVTLNYQIESPNGTVYQTQSETMLVESLRTIKRNFDTSSLPPGKYIIKLNLVYPNGVAPSSAPFTVIAKTSAQRLLGYLLFFLLMAILILTVLIIAVLIIRILNRLREQKKLLNRTNARLRPMRQSDNSGP